MYESRAERHERVSSSCAIVVEDGSQICRAIGIKLSHVDADYLAQYGKSGFRVWEK
jgi:hypothetical protein